MVFCSSAGSTFATAATAASPMTISHFFFIWAISIQVSVGFTKAIMLRPAFTAM